MFTSKLTTQAYTKKLIYLSVSIICLSVFPCVDQFVSLPVRMSVYRSVDASIHSSPVQSVSLFVYASVPNNLSLSLPMHIHPSLCHSTCLPVRLAIHPSPSLPNPRSICPLIVLSISLPHSCITAALYLCLQWRLKS